MRALSIRQPHAEAIMRGVKKIEYRNHPTKIRAGSISTPPLAATVPTRRPR